jgi:hypothetical protein
MVEDNDSALNTAMYKSVKPTGMRPHKFLVPVRMDDPVMMPTESVADVASVNGELELPEVNMEWTGTNEGYRPQQKQRFYYMQEFVRQTDTILQAVLAKEAKPCAGCGIPASRWRCWDCTDGKLFCRACMRHTHFPNPLHRIECWTGKYFRTATL